jgi:hypothetical protein
LHDLNTITEVAKYKKTYITDAQSDKKMTRDVNNNYLHHVINKNKLIIAWYCSGSPASIYPYFIQL